jgi:hypothetical protein
LTSKTCTNGTPEAITVVDGQTTECTFVNTAFAVSRGKIVVDKVTNPSQDTTEFGFTLSDTSVTLASFNLADQTTPFESDFLTPGTYAVSESTIPAGWELTNTVCNSSNSNTETASAIVLTGVRLSPAPSPTARSRR